MSTIHATIRETKTKGQVKALRNQGDVPGIIYGGEASNEKVSLSSKEVKKLIKLVRDLAWDWDRLSSCGQETMEKIVDILDKLEEGEI